MSSHLLPAIRSRVGDWHFYTTTLTFAQVAALMQEPDEIHERQKLSDWIQREVISDHSEAISKYILNFNQRFLGSLIVGVYGGHPDWASLDINATTDDFNVTQNELDRIEGKLGFLHLSGGEKLFAIDGQHRVVGIKKALSSFGADEGLKDESIAAIFVGHNSKTEQ